MKKQNDDSQKRDRSAQYERHPGDPIARLQIQRPGPATRIVPSYWLIRIDDDLRIRDQSFDVDEMLRLVSSRSNKEILDVVVGAAEAEVRVGSLQREVRSLGELSDCEKSGQSPSLEERNEKSKIKSSP